MCHPIVKTGRRLTSKGEAPTASFDEGEREREERERQRVQLGRGSVKLRLEESEIKPREGHHGDKNNFPSSSHKQREMRLVGGAVERAQNIIPTPYYAAKTLSLQPAELISACLALITSQEANCLTVSLPCSFD